MQKKDQKRVLVTMPVTDAQKDMLVRQGGDRCSFRFVLKEEATPDLLAGQDALIGNLPPALLTGNTSLQWVQLNSAGADAYIKGGVLPQDCVLTTAVGAYGLAVSEHMVALTFAMVRRLGQYMRGQVSHEWKARGQITSVEGATVLILGLGNIGGSYARKMKALGAYTIGLRRRNVDKPDYLDEQGTIDRLDDYSPARRPSGRGGAGCDRTRAPARGQSSLGSGQPDPDASCGRQFLSARDRQPDRKDRLRKPGGLAGWQAHAQRYKAYLRRQRLQSS